ncbi:MAG: TetR/AcrR family transcriptional regulator [Ruminococcus sp.]
MKKKLDFRIQRTYKLLTDALLELLKEKDFDDITVCELCDKAMIRRATFYKHFGDKYELFAFVIRELQDSFKEKQTLVYDEKRPQTFYTALLNCTLDFVDRNRSVVTSIIKCSGAGQLTDILLEEIESDLCSHFRQDIANGAILPGKPELIASMISGALIYTIKRWVLYEMDVTKEEINALCLSLMKLV